MTTFATPYGRYRWCRLPFGLSVSSEIFQKKVNQILEGLEGILDITDTLKRCRDRGVALNKDKVKLRLKEITFMGHVFTNKGLKIDP